MYDKEVEDYNYFIEAEDESNMTLVKLAVYGTLKRNARAHGMMREAKYERNGIITLPLVVFGKGFPLARLALEGEEAAPLGAELYKVPEHVVFSVIDRYEGHPTFYKRQEVPFTTLAGAPIENVFTYLWTDEDGTIQGEKLVHSFDMKGNRCHFWHQYGGSYV